MQPTKTNPCRGVAGWDMLLSLIPPRSVVHATSSILRRKAFASSEMVGHVALSLESFTPFLDLSPGTMGLEGCKSLSGHLRNKTLTEKYWARHSLGIQHSLDNVGLRNFYQLPGPDNPADGLTKLQSDMVP